MNTLTRPSITTEQLWPALLQLRRSMRAAPNYRDKINSWRFIEQTPNVWILQEDPATTTWAISDGLITCDLHQDLPPFIDDALGLSARYLQLLHEQYQSLGSDQFQITASCAQSLDGFIATNTGDSQWIGNAKNLVHAHRLRALHDGILVGSGTLLKDTPRLTVRHVEGENPNRFLVTRNPHKHQAAISKLNIKGTHVLHSEDLKTTALANAIDYHHVPETDVEGFLHPEKMVAAIKALGLRSLLVEGGGRTLSHFLKANLIRSADVQIAPILLGEGVRPFVKEAVAKISETKAFPAKTFELDSQILLSITLQASNDEPHEPHEPRKF